MPLRSNGCYKCRARKIRCDLARPGCQRCATHGVTCPGYRTEKPGDIEFRDQTGLIWQRMNDPVHGKKTYGRNASPGSSSSEEAGIIVYRPTRLQSPSANRSQLYSSFMDSYIPQNFLPEELFLKDSHFGWLPVVASITATQPALTHALDAISLVRLGNVYGDKQMLQKSVESYTMGLRSLSRALSKPSNVYDDEIMAASSILCQCEIFSEIRQHGKGWLGHLQGLQKIITARGPQALSSRLSRMLFYQSTRTSLASAMLLRKKAYYSAPKWLAAQVKIDLREDYSDSHRSGQQIPGLLERSDKLSVGHPNALEDIDELLTDCEALRAHMRAEVALLSSQTIRNGKACFALADIETFTTFSSLVSDRTLDRAYRFSSYLTTYLYSQYWLRMCLLRTCMQQVHSLRQRLLPDWLPRKDSAVTETEILGYVMNLCRCIPYMLEPLNGAIGSISAFFPMHVATQYFQAHEHRQWLQWTHSVRNAVFSKGLSIPVANYDDLASESSDEASQTFQKSFNWIDGRGDCIPVELRQNYSIDVR